MKTIRTWLVGLAFASLIGGSLVAITTPTGVSAAPPADPKCPDNVLSFPTWYRGLQKSDCEIKSPSELDSGSGKNDGVSNFIWIIVLNVIEIAMQVVGYLAAGFIIYGGFKYITGAGAPDKITAGRKLILNAVIGLVISLLAVVIVNIVLRGFN